MAWASAMTKPKSTPKPWEGRARGGPARRMSEMLPDIGGASFKRFGFVQSSIVSRWREIVGERYARVSAPESIRFPHGKRADGTLNIIVGRAYAPMMQHVVPEIIERVNRFFGYSAIAKVVIRQGEIPRPAEPAVRAPRAPVSVELGESLRTVADPELRAVLESLAQGVAANTELTVIGKVR
jgi:hypothetical protein